jgi:glucose/arabinose dehydrogenase
MPLIGTGLIQPGTGTVTFQGAPAASSTGLQSLTIQAPSSGTQIFDSYVSSGGNATLNLRTLNPGNGISFNVLNGIITISSSTTPIPGPTGPTGSVGVTGGIGMIGATGPTGATGAQGLLGATGPTAPAGIPGSPGGIGPTGSTGLQGIQGPPGSVGNTTLSSLDDVNELVAPMDGQELVFVGATQRWTPYYDYWDLKIGLQVVGSGVKIFQVVITRSITLPKLLPNSLTYAATAPTNAITLPLYQNGVQIGSVNYAAKAHNGTFLFPNQTVLNVGDILSCVSPSVIDPTFSGISVTLMGFTAALIGVPPGQVTGLITLSVTATTVALSWNAPITGDLPFIYQVLYAVHGSSNFISYGLTANTSSQTVIGLLPNTNYDFEVFAINAASNGLASTIATASTTGIVIPGAVTNLNATAETPFTVTLTWSPPVSGTPPISYQINYRTHGPGLWTAYPITVSATTAVISGLNPAINYDFQVNAFNTAGSGLSSAVFTVSTLILLAPGQVLALNVTATSGSSVSLAWTSPIIGTQPFTYQIQFRVSGQTAWISNAQISTITSQTVAGLNTSTNYNFQVYAINQGGNGQPSPSVTANTIAIVLPGQALNVAGSATSPTSLALTWLAPSTGSPPYTYQVQYRIHGTTTYIAFASITSTLTQTIIGLTAATAYDLQVATINSAGAGPYSTAITISTSAVIVLPGQPTGLTASSPTTTTMNLTWLAPTTGSAPFTYQVSYKLHSVAAFSLANSITSTVSQTIIGLNIGSSYDFEVTAINAAGSGNVSTIVTASTIAATIVPGQVTGLAAVSVTSTSISLSYLAPGTGTIPFSYQVQYRVHGQTAWVSNATTSTALAQTILTLNTSTGYDFQVYAIGPAGSGLASAVVTVSTIASTVATTWNPVDKSPTITLSNNNLTATTATAVAQAVRSGTSNLTGKFYFEILGTTLTKTFVIGIANANFTLSLVGQLGSNANGIGYYPVHTPVAGVTGGVSPSGTIITTVGPAISDANGVLWTLTSGGLVGVNGVPDTTTYQVIEIAYYNGLLYQENQENLWWYKTTPTSTWIATINPTIAGTTLAQSIYVNNNTTFTSVPADANGAIFSIAVDFGAQLFWVTSPAMRAASLPWNSTVGANPASGTGGVSFKTGLNPGPYFVCFGDATGAAVATVNFGSSAFNQIIPTGFIPWNNVTIIPGQVTNVTAPTITATGIGLKWLAPATGTTPFTYQVQYRVTGQTVFNAFPVTTSLVTQTITPLLSNTSYDFQVTAINSAGSGVISTTATARTAIGNVSVREPWLQPFNSASVWNTPIGSNAIWSNSSDNDTLAVRTAGAYVNAGAFGQAFYRGQSTDPLITFTSTDTLASAIAPQQVRCPANAMPSPPYPGGDNQMTLFDATNPGLMWSFGGCTFNNTKDVTGGVTANNGQIDNVCGTGVDVDYGTFGYNSGIGTIRTWELAAGVIQHVLRYAAPYGMLKSPGNAWDQNIPWPDTHEDYNGQNLYTGSLVAGSTIGIPNSVNLSTLGLSAGGLMLATALQNYGAIWRDSGGSSGIIFYTEPQSEGDPLIIGMRNDLNTITSQICILRNQGPNTVNGGGLPLVAIPATLDTAVCPISGIPGKVTGVFAGTAGPTSLTISWTAPTTGTNYAYQVQYRIDGTTTFSNFTLTTTATTQVITGLNSNATYDVQVYAFNAAGNGIPSTLIVTNTALAPTPGQVTSLVVTAETSTSVSLSWTAPSGSGLTYQAQYRVNGVTTWSSFPSIATGTSQVIGSLIANTNYNFQVFAINSAGNGVPSVIVTISTLSSSGTGQVTGLTSSSPTSSSLTLAWTAPVGSGGTVTSGPPAIVAPLTGTVVPGTWQTGTSTNGTAYGYLLPANYDSTKSYPLVLYLHQMSWGSFGFSYLQPQVNPWFNTATFLRAFPCFVIAPLCNQGAQGGDATINWGGVDTNDQPSQDGAISIVKQFIANYPINPAKVYVTGNSMGGIGAWDVIVKYNRLTGTLDKIFAAAFPLGGATYTYGDNGVVGAPTAAVVTALRNVPIWSIHGGQDVAVPLRWDREMYAAEQTAGGLMQYFEDPNSGTDVWDTYYPMPAGAGYWTWLFAQSLGVTGSGISTAYQVQFRLTGQTGWTNFTPQTSQLSEIVTALLANTSYDFDVYAVTATGNGPASSVLTASTAAAVSRSTWNAADASPTIALSNNNLTAKSSTAIAQAVRSTTSRTSGKLYFEVVANTITNDFTIGLASSTFALNSLGQLGSGGPPSIGYYPVSPAQSVYVNNVQVIGGVTADSSGAVLSVAVDFGAQLIWITSPAQRAAGNNWNDSPSASPASGTGGVSFSSIGGSPWFVCFGDDNGGATATVNFGQSAFNQPVPSGFTGWDAALVTMAPGQVSNLIGSAATSSSVQLNWTAPVTGSTPFTYQAQFRVHGNSGWTNFGSSAATTLQTINGLQPVTSYDFQVYATNSTGNGTPSTTLTFSTLTSTAATVWNVGDKSPTITLTAGSLYATSATSVTQSVRSTTSKSSGKVYFEITASTITTNFAIGVANASFALNSSGGIGVDLNAVGYYPVSPPQGIYINEVELVQAVNSDSSGSVIACAVDFTAHLIWFNSTRMLSDGFTWNDSTTANPATGTGGISIATLNPGPYFVTFNTMDSGSVAIANFGTTAFLRTVPSGFTGWNTVQTAVAPGATTVLTSGGPVNTGSLLFASTLSPAVITSTSIPLTWTGPTSGTRPFAYQTQYRATGQLTWNNYSIMTSVASQNVTGLQPNTSYDFQVYATNSAANGTASGVYTVSTASLVAPGQATSFAVPVITATTATLTWVPPVTGSPPIVYTAQYRLHGQTAWISFTTTVGTITVITGLTPASAYDFTVYPSNATGNGAFATIVTISTPSAGTANPRSFTQYLNVPWSLNWLPDGSMLVSQRDSFQLAHITGNTVVNISVPNTVTTQGGGGLTGLAIDPAFSTNNYIYVCQTTAFNGGYTVNGNQVIRYTLTLASNTIANPLVLVSFAANTNHNGGRLAFGPDGKLYVGTGDAASPSIVQNVTNLSGSILRINNDGTIPSDNPFNIDGSTAAANANGTRNAVWAFGFRLPQGFCWQGNTMWATDNGPQGETFGAFSGVIGYDEINLIVKGGNYGWPLAYGAATTVDTYGNTTIAAALTSGNAVTWAPQGICAANGSLYFGCLGDTSLNSQGINQTVISGTALSSVQTWFLDTYGRVRAVAIGPDGLLYFTTSNNDGTGIPLPNDDHIHQVVLPGSSTAVLATPASGLTVTATTTSSISLAWNAPLLGTSPFVYQVQFRISGTTTFLNFPQTTTNTSQVINALHAATTYDFEVVASNSVGIAAASPTLTTATSSVSTPQMLPLGYLSGAGNQFVETATGNPVRIAAVAWSGAELGNGMPYELWQVSYQTILNAAKAAGFNAIRFQFSDQGLDLSPGPSTTGAFGVNTTLNPGIVAGMTTLQMWDQLFAYCTQIGLKVWLAKMGNVGSSNVSGLWYGDGGYTDAACQAHLVGLAQHYAGNPTVFAIEINNEEQVPPVTYGDGSATDIVKMWQDTGNAIQAVNPDIMVFCQGPQGQRSAPDYLENGACDLANVPTLPVLTNPTKMAMSVRSFPNSVGNPAYLTAPGTTGSLDYTPTNLERTWGYIFTAQTCPVIIASMGSCRDGGTGNGTGVLDVAGNAAWLNSVVNFIAFGIGGIPANGFGPSWTWTQLNPAGPNSGYGETLDAGLGIISYNDYTSVLTPPYTTLLPILWYG